MKKFFLIFVFIIEITSVYAQEDLSKIPESMKYKLSQLIDDGVIKTVEKAKENDELGNKSGFVMGLMMGLKNFDAEQIIAGFEQLSSRTPALDGGLVLGYQYFFNQYVGFRISAMANVGTEAKIKATKILPANQAVAKPIQDVSQTYLPVQAGADLVILATVYEKGNSSFGISAGFGYQADWYIAQKASSKSTLNTLMTLLQSPNSMINHGIFPEFGIYYFAGSHQFEISYRFAEFSFLGEKGREWDFDLGGNKTAKTETTFLKTSSIILSYLYRF